MWTTVAVGELKGCQSSEAGYDGLFDLSGNVVEWEDSCDGTTGGNDMCGFRGGDFAAPSMYLTCASNWGSYRHYATRKIGFRCCGP